MRSTKEWLYRPRDVDLRFVQFCTLSYIFGWSARSWLSGCLVFGSTACLWCSTNLSLEGKQWIQFCRISEEYEGRLSVKNTENFDTNLDHAPWKCVISHLPCRAVVFGDESNFSHIKQPYLPDLNPRNLCLFSGLKNELKFRRFDSLQQIQQRATAGPTAITNWTARGSSNHGITAVVSVCVSLGVCVCVGVGVCVCVRAEGQ
jgi:hypothetical protein